MGIEEFEDFMPDTVTVEAFTGQDGYGEATYAAAVIYKARVVGKVKWVRTFDGSERVSTVTAYISGSTGITPLDRVTLPSGFNPIQPSILAIMREPDEVGLHHEVILT